MARQIIEQPDGKYCVFSSIVDGFIIKDATREEIVESFAEEARQDTIVSINSTFDKLESGGRPYYQFTMSYEEALETIKMRHGEE